MKEEAPKQEFETQIKKKKTTTPLQNTGESYALNKQQREEFIRQELEWNKNDNIILELKAMKNNLEAYSYNMRTDLDAQGGVLRDYVDPAIIEAYLVEINQIVDWLYEDEGKNAAKDVYLAKYNSLRKIGDPAKLRKKYFEEVGPQFVQFEKLSQNVNNQFANLAHMTDEDSQNLVKHF